MEQCSVTPKRRPEPASTNAPARPATKHYLSETADTLIRPHLFEPNFSGLKKWSSVGHKRQRNM